MFLSIAGQISGSGCGQRVINSPIVLPLLSLFQYMFLIALSSGLDLATFCVFDVPVRLLYLLVLVMADFLTINRSLLFPRVQIATVGLFANSFPLSVEHICAVLGSPHKFWGYHNQAIA
jgi:hypothetical protein